MVTVLIEREDDVVTARQRARSLAEQLGFGVQDQTRIATAVSEIARNAFGYAGGGKIEYGVDEEDGSQDLVVRVSDAGPGIADLAAVMEGRYQSKTGSASASPAHAASWTGLPFARAPAKEPRCGSPRRFRRGGSD